MRYNTSFILMALLSALLSGCIQYSDTLNRPQVSTLPADGGDVARFNQNNALPTVNTNAPQATAAAVAQSGGVHPHIEYFFNSLCALDRNFLPDASCDFSDNVAYQDEDVALVTAQGSGLEGSGGFSFFLLDLKGKPGDVLFDGHGTSVAAKRQKNNIVIIKRYDKGDVHKSSKKTIKLNKKPRAVHLCNSLQFQCVSGL